MKQIIVNVSGLSVEEKQRVNEALAKITGVRKIPLINNSAEWFFAPASSGSMMITWGLPSAPETPTHTPQQVLEMAGMAKQGHVHSESMALYAEDAKTTDKPWELWQTTTADHPWSDLQRNPEWNPLSLYRRKPKTHIVHGVEVPDLRIKPQIGEEYWFPDASTEKLVYGTVYGYESTIDTHRVSNNLCYEPTEAGKQAAILHAKACLGIA